MDSQVGLDELNRFVEDCYLDYASRGIEIGDPVYEWHIAHHPEPACLGGTKTVQLMKKDHAVHGVIQSEVFQHPCIFGWEHTFLTESYLVLFHKWSETKYKLGGAATFNTGVGIFNPLYRESSEYRVQMSDYGKIGGGQNTPSQQRARKENGSRVGRMNTPAQQTARKNLNEANVREGRGIHNPEYRKSEDYKKQKSDNAKTVNGQKWMCLETGHISNPGGLSKYQKAKGIDTSKRVCLTPEEAAFIFLWA
jgi:hypothetical protein